MDSVGTIELRGNSWVISCEPHVRARLKRVFAKVSKSSSESIRISNTPENARDLHWFIERYPMEVKHPEELANGCAQHIDMQYRMSELLSGRMPAPAIPLAKPPREYQETAAMAVQIREGLLLADDVGVGKTVSAICSIVSEGNTPAVVVVPAHLPGHWRQKLAEFAPHLRVHVIKKTEPYPLVKPPKGRQKQLWIDTPDVIVCSYHKLKGWADTLAGSIRLAIFEECQQLRSPSSDIYRACKKLASGAARRLGLSATPIYNYGSEFFYVIDCLLPGVMGTREEFVREWCNEQGGDKARIKDGDQFGAYLRREGIMLRRTRKDVGRELPGVTKISHTVDTDEKVLLELQGNAIELARKVLAHNEQFRGEKMQAAGEFDNLMRQATGIAKAPYVAEFVKLLLESGESVLLFGWHREVYNIWLERLKEYEPVMYTGSESHAQKSAALQNFIDKKSKLMIMSLRSGAGTDGMQHCCRTVVFGELDWSPGVHEQCVGRIDRDGQTDPVMAYFLVAEDGADPVMADILGIKREQIESVRNPGGALIERLETGEDHIKRLAREFLEARGVLAA